MRIRTLKEHRFEYHKRPLSGFILSLFLKFRYLLFIVVVFSFPKQMQIYIITLETSLIAVFLKSILMVITGVDHHVLRFCIE